MRPLAMILLIQNWVMAIPKLSFKVQECVSATSEGQSLVVYLHGLDPIPTSAQELGNRELLKELAKSKNFNLAILQSGEICKNQQRCWPHGTQDLLDTLVTQLISVNCGRKPQRKVLLGFSNGGYVAAKLAAQCFEGFGRYISVGVGKIGSSIKDCSALTVIMGRRDLQYTTAKKFFVPSTKTPRLRWLEHGGGHVLEKNSLSEELP